MRYKRLQIVFDTSKMFLFLSSTNLDNVSPSDKCTICDKTQNPEENCVDSFVPENRDGTEV